MCVHLHRSPQGCVLSLVGFSPPLFYSSASQAAILLHCSSSGHRAESAAAAAAAAAAAKTERARSRDRRPPGPPRTDAHQNLRGHLHACRLTRRHQPGLRLLPEALVVGNCSFTPPKKKSQLKQKWRDCEQIFHPAGFARRSVTRSSLFTCPPHVHLPTVAGQSAALCAPVISLGLTVRPGYMFFLLSIFSFV